MKESKNIKEQTKVDINKEIINIFEFLTKPFTISKQKLNILNNIKISGILAIIVSVIATIMTLVKTIFKTIRTTSYWTGEVIWEIENLKQINFFKQIIGNFLIYLIIIIAIAGAYYIGSLIIKKDVKFPRLLGISAISIIPSLIGILFIAPILSIVYFPLGIGITIISLIYTIIVIYETMNNEISLKGNMKLYFNLICLSLLFMIISYIFVKVILGGFSNNVSNIFNMLS